MKVRKRRRGARPGGLQLVILALFALVALTLFKAAEKAGVAGVQSIAGTMAKGAIAATAAAFIARAALLRLGLVFMAPWVAGALAVAAFMYVGAWDISASAFGLPPAPDRLKGRGSDALECGDGLKWLNPATGTWQCRAA